MTMIEPSTLLPQCGALGGVLLLLRDRKKLNSGVRVRGVIKFTELGKFKLAIFQKNKR
jgi:hypothetical protein